MNQKKRGRPSKFTEAVKAEILHRMTMGESIRKICKDDHLPHWGTLMRFLLKDENKDFRAHYAQAREFMIDAWVIDAYDVSHDESRDQIASVEVIESPRGRTVKKKKVRDNTASQRDRLKVDTILKIAAKLNPKKYGDIQRLEHSGPDSGPIQLQAIDRPPKETFETWQARVQKELAAKNKNLLPQ